MPTAVPSTRESSLPAAERTCRICGGKSHGAHFGVDSCRACAAFFRRCVLQGKKGGGCGRRECAGGKCCKACRFKRCLDYGMPREMVKGVEEVPDGPSPCGCPPCCSSDCSTLCTPSLPPVIPSNPHMALLHKVEANYKEYCMQRLEIENDIFSGEVDWGVEEITPKRLNEGTRDLEFPVRLSVFSTHNRCELACTSALHTFIAHSFDQFTTLPYEEKWRLFKHYSMLQGCAEAMRRSLAHYTERPLKRFLISWTTAIDCDEVKAFWKDTEMSETDSIVESCERVLKGMQRIACGPLEMLNLKDTEFVALLILLMWSPNVSAGSGCSEVAATVRATVFRELHVLYRDEMKLSNYALRLGELMSFLTALEAMTASLEEELKLFSIFDMFEKDSWFGTLFADAPPRIFPYSKDLLA